MAEEGKSVLEYARRYREAGLSVIAVKTDGTKMPDAERMPGHGWNIFRERHATDDELVAMFSGRVGIGIVGGKASGNLEIIDVDEPGLFERLAELVEAESSGLIDRLPRVQTPSRCVHLYYRANEIAGNKKLAMRPTVDEQGRPKRETLIETRGEGGYVVAPGSPIDCHVARLPYTHVGGPPLTSIPMLTAEERGLLIDSARLLNECVTEEPQEREPRERQPRSDDGLSPGDDFNQRATWEEILEPHGWRRMGVRAGRQHWMRPGKAAGSNSATTGTISASGNDLLCVFSSNAYPLEGATGDSLSTSYTKFAAFAILNHKGNYSEAARALSKRGYGERQSLSPPADRNGHAQTNETAAPSIEKYVAPGHLANATFEGDPPKCIPILMEPLIADILRQTNNWPRRVGEKLFVDSELSGLRMLPRQSHLFGYLSKTIGRVEWFKGLGCVPKDELFSQLSEDAESYLAIENRPHFPPLKGHYYTFEAQRSVKPGDGRTLEMLLDRFCPLTELDRDLMKAAIVTPFWGGSGGTRPAFLITAPKGRGQGKTKFIEFTASLVGGFFDFSNGEDAATIKKRLLTAESLTKRVVLVDNIKTNKFSWAEMEALITASHISGHQLYTGEQSRPNTLTFFFSVNGAAMSKDMAQRSIEIKLAAPQYAPDWEDETRRFVSENQARIIADVAAFFAKSPVSLDRCSRWGSWDRAVLARLPEPEELQAVIAERREQVDADDEEYEIVVDFFSQQLNELDYDPVTDRVHIPNNIAAQWFSSAMNQHTSANAMTRAIRQYSNEKERCKFTINPSRAYSRGVLWNHEHNSVVHHDLLQRLKRNENREYWQ